MAVPNVFRRGGPVSIVEKAATAARASGYIEELYATSDQYVGVWNCDTASGDVGALAVAGIYQIAKADSTLSVAVGAPVALTISAGEASAGGATGGHHRAAAVAAATDATMLVLINVR